MPTRIAYVNKSIIDSNEANAIHVRHMYRALTDAGAHVTPLARFRKVNSFGESVIPVSNDLFDSARLAVKTLGTARNCDCVYGRHLPSLFAIRNAGVSVLYESHAMTKGLAHHLESRLLGSRTLKRVIVISEQLKVDMLARYRHLDAESVEVLRDGAVIPAGSVASRPTTSHTGNRIRCGYVGNLYPGKGAALLPVLAARVPECDFHLAGGTEAEVRSLLRRINLAMPANLTCHGTIPHESIQAFYAGLDIALLPLQQRALDVGGSDIGRWTSPLKLFEYMANGLPIIASDLAILREVLRDNRNALLVKHDSVDAWVRAIRGLANSPVLRHKIGLQAHQDAVEKYSWQLRAERVLALASGQS